MFARHGLDPLVALSIVAGTSVCSPAARVAGEMMVRDVFAPMFPVDLVQKDLAYAVEAAGAVARAPMIEATRGQFVAAAARGHGGEHITAVVRNIRAS
jgi:3-hydroxyisobutyrate dehydrogenase